MSGLVHSGLTPFVPTETPLFAVNNGLYWDVSVGPEAHSQSVGSCHRNGILGYGDDGAGEVARLFAAAPEMLTALRLILPLAKGYAPEGQTATAKRTCNSWIEAAEAAIAKATGAVE